MFRIVNALSGPERFCIFIGLGTSMMKLERVTKDFYVRKFLSNISPIRIRISLAEESGGDVK